MLDQGKVSQYQTSVGDFVCLNTGDTFNLLLGIFIFVVYGMILALNPYGWSDGEGFDVKPHCDMGKGNDFSNGYCSGVHGPGAFIVSLVLMVVAIVVYFVKLAKYMSCPDRIEQKRREDSVTMNTRQSSYAASLMKEEKDSRMNPMAGQ